MFTGIIENMGRLKEKKDALFVFEADQAFCKQLSKGTSVSVNGVCLTVLKKPLDTSFSIQIMPETQKKTALSQLTPSSIVNLELPASTKTFLSGHIVQGHVDGVGKIDSIQDSGNSKLFTFAVSRDLTKYIVEKGSITVNGISLTVITCTPTQFSVGIIPFTWEHTMLHTVKVGDKVNIEVDVLAKYVEKLLSAR